MVKLAADIFAEHFAHWKITLQEEDLMLGVMDTSQRLAGLSSIALEKTKLTNIWITTLLIE